MKRVLKIITVLAVLALGVWIFRILFPGDEKLIRKLLVEAAETAAIKPNENPLFKLAGANKLVGFFSSDAVLKVEVSGVDVRSINGRDDLRQAVTAARATLQEAKIQLHQIHVNVDPDRQSASAQFIVTAYLNGGSDPMVQELKLQLRKIDSHWKIAQVETVKTLGM